MINPKLSGKSPLREAHAVLNATLLRAYGFSARKDLLEFNLDVAEREKAGQAMTVPLITKSYLDAGG